MVELKIDVAVEVAWQAFGHRLAASLVELEPGGVVRVGLPTGLISRSPVALQLRRRPHTVLLSAVGSPPSSVPGSPPRRRPSTAAPVSKVFKVGDEVSTAGWVVTALRESYAVIHPAFLDVGRWGGMLLRPAVSQATGVPSPALPTTPDELEDLVVQTLEPVLERPVDRDADGDIEIESRSGTVYVRVRRDRPLVEVFSVLAVLDTEHEVAAAVTAANERNTRSTSVTFVVCADLVVARVLVPARPFQPTQLLSAVAGLMHELEQDEQHDQIDAQDEHVSVETASHPLLPNELLTILHLEVDRPGSVSAALAAQIYAYDRDRLLTSILVSEQEEIAWRASVDEAGSRDEEEAEVCRGEERAWGQTVGLLRAALRLTVER